MAWRSSGTNNDEMIDNLKRYGVIHSVATEAAFRAVDRRFFVPQNRPDLAHSDQPLREGSVHISAPHIYGCIVEALDVTPDSSFSFLNVGSGTGYISSVVAHIIGPTGLCYGVENNSDTLEHCVSAMDRFKRLAPIQVVKRLSHLEFIHGNGLEIDAKTGEALVGFDRIYVGAAVEQQGLNQLASLLKVGGVLVAPVDDDLVKVTRICSSNNGTVARAPRSFRGRTPPLSSDYSQQVISGVRFSPLLSSPSLPTTIRSRVWEPALHCAYPESFRRSCKEILLCANAATVQPAPPVVVTEQINVAAQLPRSIWMEILSFTHRDWFAKPHCEVEILRRRLEQEQLALQRAQAAQAAAESRLRRVESDRENFRAMALRCQARLEAVLAERGTDIESLGDDDGATASLYRDAMILRLGGMGAIMRRLHSDTEDLDDSEDDDDEENHEDDEDVDDQNDATARGEEMDSESEDENSSDMEESEFAESDEFDLMASSSSPIGVASIQGRQVRTVSISNDGA